MKTILLTILVVLLVEAELSDATTSNGNKLLFAGVVSNLSIEEQIDIFDQLGFTISRDGKKLLYDEEDVGPEVEFIDLNGDKLPEVFVSYGTWATCGNTERCLALFVKNSKGKYVKVLDVAAIGYEKLAKVHLGFPDIALDGTDFCRGVWRWDGNIYSHFKNMPTEKGGCDAIKNRRKAH
jgi:hypothetical protein